MKRGISHEQGVVLITAEPQDLTLQGMRAKIGEHVPVRKIRHDAVLRFLTVASERYSSEATGLARRKISVGVIEEKELERVCRSGNTWRSPGLRLQEPRLRGQPPFYFCFFMPGDGGSIMEMELDGLVDSLLNRMTLEEKLGQLFMVGFSGTEPDASIREWIERCHLGNVVLFAGNLVDPPQVLRLTGELQALARAAQGAGTPEAIQGKGFIPLFIAADQEGGIVVRITRGATVFPGNMALGATRDPELARRAAAVMGYEMRAMGIQFNLAPVVDVNCNPRNPVIGVRSYGEDPELVAELGVAQIEGYQQFVVATAKHFPGHGDTTVDSHLARPVVGHDKERLWAVELLPFRRAIAAGVGAIMTAHLSVPGIEPDLRLPATLSRRVITGLLREELGYDGIIITDSLGMRGVSAEYDMVEASLLALEAGCDILCASSHTYYGTFVYDAVLAAVRTGRISAERVEQSARRVLRAKARFGLLAEGGLVREGREGDRTEGRDEGLVEVEGAGGGRAGHDTGLPWQVGAVTLAEVGSPAHRAVAQEVARRAITQVKGPAALPAGTETVVVIEFSAQAQTGVEDLRLERGTVQGQGQGQGQVREPAGSTARGPAQTEAPAQTNVEASETGPLATALQQLFDRHHGCDQNDQNDQNEHPSQHPSGHQSQHQSRQAAGPRPRVAGLVLPLNPDPDLRQRLLARLTTFRGQEPVPGPPVPGGLVAVVATLDAVRNAGQAELIRELTASGIPVWVVSLRNPYELSLLGEAAEKVSFLVAYSPQPVSLAAAAEVLSGELIPCGRLPVTLP